MLDSVYVGLSGLSTYSAGLRTISNNVANLNSTGYKGDSLQFSDLFYKMSMTVNGESSEQYYAQGTGVGIRSERVDFADGELRTSTSTTDVGLAGQGMFILKRDGQYFYTRSGNFEFDTAGYLVDVGSKARVQGLGGSGDLQDINIQAQRFSPAKPTAEIKLSGQFSQGDTSGQTLGSVPLYDAAGGVTQATIKMVPGDTTTRSWKVTVSIPSGTLVSDQEIRFNGDTTPATGFNTVTFSYTPTGGSLQTVTLNFGTPNAFDGVLFFSSTAATVTDNQVKVSSQDGKPVGALQKTAFDSKGLLNLTYSNGNTATGGRLALAWFNDLDALARADQARFINASNQKVTIGGAGDTGFGSISGSKLEASNVDLAKEFSELIIIQRGYQTSSQIVQAANEMAQQLLEVAKQK